MTEKNQKRQRRVALLSQSELKLAALRAVIETDELHVVPVDSGDTGCPQPVGYLSALQCLMLRMENAKKAIDGFDVVVGIESYIEKWGDDYIDNVAICFRPHWCEAVYFVQPTLATGVVVPRRLWPSYSDGFHRLGSLTTVGAKCEQESGGAVRPDDWFQYADPANVSRQAQIEQCLRTTVFAGKQ